MSQVFEELYQQRSIAPQLQEQAWNEFVKHGLPTKKHEDWKYTSLHALADKDFVFAHSLVNEELEHKLEAVSLPGANTLVFVNGEYCAELSSVLDEAILVKPLQDAIANDSSVEVVLETQTQSSSLTALNQALMQSGLYIEVAQGKKAVQPLQIIHVMTESDNVTQQPCHVIRLQAQAEASVVECFVSSSAEYFTNASTYFDLQDNSHLHYVKWIDEGSQAQHVSTTYLQQARDSQAHCFALSLGGRLVRYDTVAYLNESGAFAKLNGLYLPTANQHVDHHTSIYHNAANTQSAELYKGVMTEKGHGVFNGRVIVQQDAQHIQADQANHNLLLSQHAQIDTKPQLEIFADDVKCSHGATVGQLDADALFYLTSRGISEADAKRLLLEGFVVAAYEEIADDTIRAWCAQHVANKLAQM